MSQPSALPRPLSPEAIQLIDGQYADRPHLRPILDAVLAALPSLGPVTVEARQTLVSLVTPRRTFAVVQATTRTRVDLGLRLAGPAPGPRLLPAKNLGAATARIALTGPAEFDDEALGWLRLAYQCLTKSGTALPIAIIGSGRRILGSCAASGHGSCAGRALPADRPARRGRPGRGVSRQRLDDVDPGARSGARGNVVPP